VTETTDGGLVRLPGEGQAASLCGDTYVVKAVGEETGGALAVIEPALLPTAAGHHFADLAELMATMPAGPPPSREH